uniref:Uncharacterized protein n=1 Tax=Sphaerodactylus townsendi TaxID=933632 RepID=A0ACB8FTL5_9SAUR
MLLLQGTARARASWAFRVRLVGFSPLESVTMDDYLYYKYSPNNTNTYFCNICKVYGASALHMQAHFLGARHKAAEEALKAHGIVKPLNSSAEPESVPVDIQAITAPGTTLEEQLNACKDAEPAIGLEYITEYRSEENLAYKCHLCGCLTGLTHMFVHVLGVKHRQAYLLASDRELEHESASSPGTFPAQILLGPF